MKDSLVNYYFRKFVFYFKNNNRSFNYDLGYNNIKESIKQIIDHNRDYLLTESYMDYMSSHNTYFVKNLKDLSSDDELLPLTCLFDYFMNIYGKYVRYGTNRDEYVDGKYVDLLNDDIREATIKAYDSIQHLQDNMPFNSDERYLIRSAIIIVLCHCVLNQKLFNYSDLVDLIVKDPTFILDDILVNDLDLENDNCYIVSRIASIVDSKYNTVIK